MIDKRIPSKELRIMKARIVLACGVTLTSLILLLGASNINTVLLLGCAGLLTTSIYLGHRTKTKRHSRHGR
jgi:hypothetical protein